MIMTFGAGALALALLGGGIAIAAQPTPVPNTAPDFTSMRFLIGPWSCHQTLSGRPGDRRETDTCTMAYDGWQMQDHSVSPPFDKFRNRDIVGDSRGRTFLARRLKTDLGALAGSCRFDFAVARHRIGDER
jgi:hypothetical protein